LRLGTLHNLSFVAALMAELRSAIDGGRLEEVAAGLRAGVAPGGVTGGGAPAGA
jgi:queuine tRNA-ribosyltransferase